MTQAPPITPKPTPKPTPTRVVGIFTVPSRTHEGEAYTTDIRDQAHPMCTCPAGQAEFANCKHVAYCWHVRACIEVQAELDRARSRALIVRPQGLAALQECYV